MSSETSIERQQIYPILTYADAPAAIDFLCRAFGFEEVSVLRVPDGRVAHAVLSLHGLHVMLSSEFEQLDNCAPGGGDLGSSRIHIHVPDVEAHFSRALAEGAIIVRGLEDKYWGLRSYLARDPEGHLWSFTQRVRVVPEDELLRELEGWAEPALVTD